MATKRRFQTIEDRWIALQSDAIDDRGLVSAPIIVALSLVEATQNEFETMEKARNKVLAGLALKNLKEALSCCDVKPPILKRHLEGLIGVFSGTNQGQNERLGGDVRMWAAENTAQARFELSKSFASEWKTAVGEMTSTTQVAWTKAVRDLRDAFEDDADRLKSVQSEIQHQIREGFLGESKDWLPPAQLISLWLNCDERWSAGFHLEGKTLAHHARGKFPATSNLARALAGVSLATAGKRAEAVYEWQTSVSTHGTPILELDFAALAAAEGDVRACVRIVDPPISIVPGALLQVLAASGNTITTSTIVEFVGRMRDESERCASHTMDRLRQTMFEIGTLEDCWGTSLKESGTPSRIGRLKSIPTTDFLTCRYVDSLARKEIELAITDAEKLAELHIASFQERLTELSEKQSRAERKRDDLIRAAGAHCELLHLKLSRMRLDFGREEQKAERGCFVGFGLMCGLFVTFVITVLALKFYGKHVHVGPTLEAIIGSIAVAPCLISGAYFLGLWTKRVRCEAEAVQRLSELETSFRRKSEEIKDQFVGEATELKSAFEQAVNESSHANELVESIARLRDAA